MNKNYVIRRELFVLSKNDEIKEQYQFLKELGKGAYGKVYLARQRMFPHHLRAVKAVTKKHLRNPTPVLNEIKVMGRLDHPHIVKLYETFQDQKHLFLVLDYCPGKELFDRLADCECFSQERARQVFRQMVVAVRYLHSQRVSHRDLKLQNFMMDGETQWEVRLIDFGLSFPWKKNMREEVALWGGSRPVGTCYYMAPEVLTGCYDERCDIWSLGVVLYMMVTGTPPFDGEKEEQIIERIRHSHYSLETPECKRLAPALLDLIYRMLRPESLRISLEEILTHPWMSQPCSQTPLQIDFSRLKNFARFSKLKKIVATFITAHLSENQMHSLRAVFQGIDRNSDGYLSVEEFARFFSQKEWQMKEVLAEMGELMAAADLDHNGKLNYNEFLSSCLDASLLSSEEYLRFVFTSFDLNKDDRIGREELTAILKAYSQDYHCNLQLVEQLITQNDNNKDGVIDFEEFCQAMKYIQGGGLSSQRPPAE